MSRQLEPAIQQPVFHELQAKVHQQAGRQETRDKRKERAAEHQRQPEHQREDYAHQSSVHAGQFDQGGRDRALDAQDAAARQSRDHVGRAIDRALAIQIQLATADQLLRAGAEEYVKCANDDQGQDSAGARPDHGGINAGDSGQIQRPARQSTRTPRARTSRPSAKAFTSPTTKCAQA